MAKISKHNGPSDAQTGQGMPLTDDEKAQGERRTKSAADLLRERRKLGPYLPDAGAEQVQLTPGHSDPETGEATPAEPTHLPPERPREGQEEEMQAETVTLEQPARNASREAWVNYVEALTDEDVPEDTTRAELIEMYGSPPS
jgi:hypothetical protein